MYVIYFLQVAYRTLWRTSGPQASAGGSTGPVENLKKVSKKFHPSLKI